MSLFTPPNVRATDANNAVVSGAKWYFYLTTTETPTDTYTTSARSVAHANPVVADSGGKFASIYLDPAITYRAVLKTSAGSTIYDFDPLNDYIDTSDAAASTGSNLFGHIDDITKITGAVATTVRDRIRPDQNRVISLMSVLTASERADVIAGTNAIDITAKLATLLSDVSANYPGATVDASMVRGTWTWTADPFASIYACKATLLTGEVVIKKNFNSGPITLPSLFHWQMDRTEFKPTVAITAITSNASPAVGMLQTKDLGAVCSGTAGASTVTLASGSDSARIVAGAQIGFPGFTEFTAVAHTLNGAINSSVTSFTITNSLSPNTTIGSSTVYLKIDSEIMLATISSDGLSASSVTRGVHGTTAASHADLATVTLMSTRVYEVVSVSGTTVTIDDTLPYTFTSLTAYVGSSRTRLSGRFTIDGEYDRVANGSYSWSGVSSTLSGGFWAEGDIDIKQCAHGGFFQMGCKGLRVKGRMLYKCGRPTASVGSSIWGFGGGQSNSVEFEFADNGYAAVILDHKSSGVPSYGLIGSETQSVYRIGNVSVHTVMGEISSATDNTVVFDRVVSTATMMTFENSLASSQTTAAVPALRNTVEIKNYAGVQTGGGTNVADNTTLVNGTPTPLLVTASTITLTAAGSGREIILDRAAGITVTLPAATGTGLRYAFKLKTSASGGSYIIKVADATDAMDGMIFAADDTATPVVLVWVTAADSDTITLDGTTTGGLIGDRIELVDLATNQWAVSGAVKQSGSEATPFSATV